MDSIWQKSTELPQFPSLTKDIKTDVLVIGGGLAGILTAYKLKEKERDSKKISKPMFLLLVVDLQVF